MSTRALSASDEALTEELAGRASRDWTILAAATIGFGIGFGIYTGTFPNFAAEHLGISRERLGLLEALREVPGLLTALLVSLLASFTTARLAVLALLITGAGFAASGRVPLQDPFWFLVGCNILWSVGLHVWLTAQPSLTLTLTGTGRHGFGLGLMNRYLSIAVIIGLVLVRVIAPHVGFDTIFLLAGTAAILGGLCALRLHPARGGKLKQRLVFRPAYWRYYGLMLLDGGRRQVVQTFALLILVKEFHVSIESVAVMLIVNNLLTLTAAPHVGRWTDRFGERPVLTLYYALVAGVFFTYTQIGGLSQATGLKAEWLFYAIFALDNLLFTASVGIQTYIRHTAPPEDLSASLAMGLTWNHIAAVTVPLAAGWIWAQYGYQRIFLCGIGLALVSLAMCLTLPHRKTPVERAQ